MPITLPNKLLQLALMDPASVSLSQNAHCVKCAIELGCYMARSLRATILVALCLIPFGYGNAEEPESLDRLVFYTPVNMTKMVSEVAERQEQVAAGSVVASVTIQYGTEAEWQNACAWLQAQEVETNRYYIPTQGSLKETAYYCYVSGSDSQMGPSYIVELHAIVEEVVGQFGGAVWRWSFSFLE
ncbi:MAG: hypothetical protein AAGH76_14945 [Pseudomonadota bacterium]